MFKRLFCKHEWIETKDFWSLSQFVCVKCGHARIIDNYNVVKWKVRQNLRGHTFKE